MSLTESRGKSNIYPQILMTSSAEKATKPIQWPLDIKRAKLKHKTRKKSSGNLYIRHTLKDQSHKKWRSSVCKKNWSQFKIKHAQLEINMADWDTVSYRQKSAAEKNTKSFNRTLRHENYVSMHTDNHNRIYSLCMPNKY